MKRLLLTGVLALASVLASNVSAETIHVDASYSGFYTSSGARNGITSGILADNTHRNWLAFDLSGVTDEIQSASLTVFNHSSNTTSADFTWVEVTTSFFEVLTDAGDGIDTYNDLADGSIFATGTANAGTDDSYSLNSLAVSSLNSTSGFWLVGGYTPEAFAMSYGFTNGVGSGDLIRLTVETPQISAVPVPAAGWLFASGIIGLIAVARRRQ